MKKIKNKKERGITLIALVVTIIVLIILAGVSINLLFGNFGVVTKAKEAKNKMEAAQYEEELKMCVLELQADAVTNGTEFSMETIRKNLVEKVKKVENTTDIEFPTKESATKSEGKYKGYEFYIDEKYVVHVENKKTGEIEKTDKTEPADFTIKAENTEKGLKITQTPTDTENKYEYYVKKSTDSNYTKYDSNIIANLPDGIYDIKVIAYNKAGNPKVVELKSFEVKKEVKKEVKRTNISAQDIKNDPETYYGLKVTNYTSVNGQNDWRIFYSDGTHIFLITGGYIDTREANRISTSTGMGKSKYSAYWGSARVPAFQTVNSATLTRFKATEYVLQRGRNNSSCVSTLLNDNNWSSYKDSGNKAEKAIGSSTVEMWMDSWNSRYKKSSDQLYRKASTSTSNPGYYVGTSPDPTGSYSIQSSVMSTKEGCNNKLYYPNISGYDSTWSYWLASPSAESGREVLEVFCHRKYRWD